MGVSSPFCLYLCGFSAVKMADSHCEIVTNFLLDTCVRLPLNADAIEAKRLCAVWASERRVDEFNDVYYVHIPLLTGSDLTKEPVPRNRF